MEKKIAKVFSTATFKQSVITLSSTFVNGLLGIAFYILLGRFLGPVNFGIFSVATLTMTLLSDIANVGTDTGIVRFVGKYRVNDNLKALRFLKLGLEIKFVVGIVLLIVGWFVVPWIATDVLAKTELAHPLKYALLGAFGVLLFSLTTSAIQAYEKFTTWGVLNISLNALRLTGIVLLFVLGILNIESSLLIYIVFPFIGFIVGSFFLPNYFFVNRENEVFDEFLHYNKWVALFILIVALSTRLDSFLSAKLLTLHELGIYSAAVGLASVVPQIVTAIAVVVAPKLSSFDSSKKAWDYLTKLQIFVTFTGIIGLIIGSISAYFLIPILYGNAYVNSVGVFLILLLAQVIFFVSIPAHTAVIYYFGYPKLFVYISFGHLLIMAVLGWVLISSFGYIGAAYAVLIGNMWNFIVPFVWVLREFKYKDEN